MGFIEIQSRPCGFFSNFRTVLGLLHTCEIGGHKPSVRFDLGEACYRDPAKMGHCNWWNYYFKPISQDPNAKKLRKSRNEASLSKTRINRKRGNELIKKHIILRKDIAKLINEFYIKHMAKYKTVGVHMRGTDSYLWLKKNRKRSLYNINEIIAQLKPTCNKYDKIFIASDQYQYVQKIKKHFGSNKVIAINTTRSKTRANIHGDDQISGYQKGLGALMDCILLSKCDYLMRSSSNLSKTALYYNPDIQHKKLIGNL
jgi:hypothetical protein